MKCAILVLPLFLTGCLGAGFSTAKDPATGDTIISHEGGGQIIVPGADLTTEEGQVQGAVESLIGVATGETGIAAILAALAGAAYGKRKQKKEAA
jgi:hypothetical protein